MIKLLFTLLMSLLLTFSVGSVLAKSDQEIAKKYGFSFPVKGLGNCQNLSECKTYCDDVKNQDTCIKFAKQKGFHQESKTEVSDDEVLQKAKGELGCNSIDQCMAFCDKEENMEKCIDFAAKHNLAAGGNAGQMKQVLSSLKSALGCSSMKACMDTCNGGDDNAKKCMEIFKQAGFATEVTYSDPGGCNSEESCKAYCEKNPKECGESSDSSAESPEAMCSKLSSECKWDGKSCICAGPESCAKSAGCSWNGQYCSCGGEYSTNQPEQSGESWCAKAGSDCKWTGSTCQCGGSSMGGYTQDPPEVWCPKAGPNCSWDGKQCTCGQTQDTTPQTSTPAQPDTTQPSPVPADNPYTVQGGETIYKSECLAAGCKWSDNPNSCDCAGVGKDVQGVSTKPGLLQQLIDFLLGYLS